MRSKVFGARKYETRKISSPQFSNFQASEGWQNNGFQSVGYKVDHGSITMPTQHHFLGINMTALSQGNFLERFAYETANAINIPIQYLMFRSVNDGSMRNLDGTSTTSDQFVITIGTMPLSAAGGARTAAALENPFSLNGGYGIFGKNGLNVGNYRVEMMYANPSINSPKAGTFFSLKQMKPGGALWRLDNGIIHGTDQMRLHSTIRFYWKGIKYGSTTQRYWYPSSFKPPFFKPLK
ncbi:hypothetical protein ABH942_001639 [Flavobacterium sp. 28YEA47A]|uniref:hypothetical protein n=1 Tax=Flavobacterium sp. 28YEA47A TaxID=3156276 RepID=UPI00351459F4